MYIGIYMERVEFDGKR